MRLVIAVAAVAAVSLAACGRKEEAPKPGVQVSSSGGVVVTGKDGTTVRVGEKAEAPDFAPLYPGGKSREQVATMDSGDLTSGTVVYTTEATPEAVVEFYRKQAEAKGLAPAMNADMGAAKMFTAEDQATRRAVQVIVSAESGTSNVTVTWSRPKG